MGGKERAVTIEGLNALVESGGIDEYIRVCEARQVKALSKIADDITSRPGVKIGRAHV